MNTYKNIIIDCLNNDKVIPPRIRLNIYDKILIYFIQLSIAVFLGFILCKIELLLLNL